MQKRFGRITRKKRRQFVSWWWLSSSWSLKTECTQKPNWSVHVRVQGDSLRKVGHHHLSFTTCWTILLSHFNLPQKREPRRSRERVRGAGAWANTQGMMVTQGHLQRFSQAISWGNPAHMAPRETALCALPCVFSFLRYTWEHRAGHWGCLPFHLHAHRSGVVTTKANLMSPPLAPPACALAQLAAACSCPNNTICGERHVPTSSWRGAWCSLQPQRLSQLESFTEHSPRSRDC